MRLVNKIIIVLMMILIGLPIVFATDPWANNGDGGGLSGVLGGWLSWGLAEWDFILTGDISDKYTNYNAMREHYCYTVLPANAVSTTGVDMIEYYTMACNLLREHSWYNFPDDLWTELYEQSFTIRPYSVEALVEANVTVTDPEVRAYECARDSIVNDKYSSQQNTVKVWGYVNFVVGLVLSLLLIMYYMVEIMFVAYLFLELIPKLMIKFRDVLVNYFIGRL